MMKKILFKIKELFKRDDIDTHEITETSIVEVVDKELEERIRKRRDTNKNTLKNLKNKNLALDVFKEMLEDNELSKTYTEKEIVIIYENILDDN